jgi:uncharacterized protein DUF1592/uncharacterized protein DUF1588/uncharacterized protein DUF1595/uncharacterized protein DUF1585/uncharacterized protein DUF1587
MRSSVSLLLLGTLAFAAAAALAAACAQSGRMFGGTSSSGASAGTTSGTTTSDGGVSALAMDAGACAPTAPPVLGVSAFNGTCGSAGPTVDFSLMRRISRIEYNNMVRDLLGDTTQPATNFVLESPMTTGVNLQTNTYAPVSELIAQQYLSAAETLAETAVASSPGDDGGASGPSNLTNVYNLNGIAACPAQNDACAQQFISAFANRAFRGHLDSDESTALFNIYSNIADAPNNLGFVTGIQAVITAVLSSPYFLYVIELGDGSTPTGSAMPLSQNEIAARLSFFLWRTLPDATLMSAAASGALSTPAQIQAQAQRMLADPKALDAINDFTTQWLEIASPPSGKDVIFTNWAKYPTIGQEMQDETRTNVSQLILTENGNLTELLTSPASYVNADLAAFYGPVSLGSGPAVTVTDSALTLSGQNQYYETTLPNREGILTNGSILAGNSHSLLPSVVLRGKMIREDILCEPVGDPPPNVPALPATVPDGGTTRQLFQAHTDIGGANGACYGCHHYMDFIGFGLGNYDATGAYQALDENGATTGPALDVTGQIYPCDTPTTGCPPAQPNELNATFNGATGSGGLIETLAGSTQVNECFALQAFRYSLGRLETADDACSMQEFYSAFTGSSLNIQKLLLAIVGSDAFSYRSVIGAACEAADAGSSCP